MAKGSKAASSGVAAVVERVSARLGQLGEFAGSVYTRVTPAVTTVVDYAWFIGSTALLLSLPVLVEIQRETTVLVMQRQREAEMAQIQEQARMAHGGVVEQMKGLGSLLTGSQQAPQ